MCETLMLKTQHFNNLLSGRIFGNPFLICCKSNYGLKITYL